MFRGRVIEIRLIHIVFLLIFLILSAGIVLSYMLFREYLLYSYLLMLFFLLFFIIWKFVPDYYYFELSSFIRNYWKKSLIIFLSLALISTLFFIPINFSLNFDFIKTKNINFNLFDSSKAPTLEHPQQISPDGKQDVTTTSTTLSTTTSTSTTTTIVTTTTTQRETESDKRGFFFTSTPRQEKNQPENCDFGGRGHDAVLMPSGNYYCRSTQQRITIYVDGVEKICCVTPH